MRGLNALDFLVIVAYLVGVTLLGIWVGRRQRDANDYFVADRAIPWWAVMFSIVASETSALTFISIPGLAYRTNLGFLEIATGYLLGRIVLAYTLLPRYYEGNLVTAYALLEKRFSSDRGPFDELAQTASAGDVFIGCNCPTRKNPDVKRCHTVLALKFMKKKYSRLKVDLPR